MTHRFEFTGEGCFEHDGGVTDASGDAGDFEVGSSGELSAAPNDDMPNAGEYDFLCTCGRLYNLTDVQ